ncbi:MAG: fluoride efflux transporter CrcB [Lutibacter sp.]|nr:fluoride efflux transporter CrcB [Lutibacter sp.]
MKQALLVFVGGGFGSVSRYFLGKWLNNFENAIPYGTMLSNVLGSLLIGLILGYFAKTSNISESQSLLLATGFCGGFTTFSTFAYENHLYLKNGDYLNFLPYTLGSLILGFSAVFLGLYISKFL